MEYFSKCEIIIKFKLSENWREFHELENTVYLISLLQGKKNFRELGEFCERGQSNFVKMGEFHKRNVDRLILCVIYIYGL